MSGEGPESIPTSADPRSKRPTKKRALSPTSNQSASIEALFKKPDQHIPTGTTSSRRLNSGGGGGVAPPPEIVANVQGSSAGAGSGEFHVYKAARRREYERLRIMDEQLRKEVADEEFEKNKEEMGKKDDEKTRRNREKREKMKARKAKAKGGGGGGACGGQPQKNGVGGAGGGGGGGYSKGPRIDALRGLDKENGGARQQESSSHETEADGAGGAGDEPKGIVIEDD